MVDRRDGLLDDGHVVSICQSDHAAPLGVLALVIDDRDVEIPRGQVVILAKEVCQANLGVVLAGRVF
jgi:hypothetical protein